MWGVNRRGMKMDFLWDVYIVMGLQAIVGLIVWMFVNQIIGAIIIWTAVGIDFIAIGIEIFKRGHKE